MAAFSFTENLTLALLMSGVIAMSPDDGHAGDGPIPVEVVQTDDGWALLRDGVPYPVRGVGRGEPAEGSSVSG